MHDGHQIVHAFSRRLPEREVPHQSQRLNPLANQAQVPRQQPKGPNHTRDHSENGRRRKLKHRKSHLRLSFPRDGLGQQEQKVSSANPGRDHEVRIHNSERVVKHRLPVKRQGVDKCIQS